MERSGLRSGGIRVRVFARWKWEDPAEVGIRQWQAQKYSKMISIYNICERDSFHFGATMAFIK